jgi:hypothetical protein
MFALVAAVMWAANRWIGRTVAVGIGVVALAYFAYAMITGAIYCAAEPTYIPPTEAEAAMGSEGMMHFNCDSAGGAITYFYLYIISPVLMASIGFLTFRYWRKGQRS